LLISRQCEAMHIAYRGCMPVSRADVATDVPERFIRQLVSHLGHKLTTEMLPDGAGVIAVSGARCTLTARTGQLMLEATADDTDSLAHVQNVVARHLERFGARAGLRVRWDTPVTDG
jgi:caffeoyl-CoA O-methyltransferase